MSTTTATLLGYAGAATALLLSNAGAAIGTAKSSRSLSVTGLARPDLATRSLISVVICGVLALYGLIVSTIIARKIAVQAAAAAASQAYCGRVGVGDLAAGIVCGGSNLAAGWCLGVVGEGGIRATEKQPRFFWIMVMVLVFAEAIGLYGLILGLYISGMAVESVC